MSEITTAIEARQAQIIQLQRDIETLQRAASIMGGRTKATAKATSRKAPSRKAPSQSRPKPKTKRKRRPWSAASKQAMSKRIKASWAKRKRAQR